MGPDVGVVRPLPGPHDVSSDLFRPKETFHRLGTLRDAREGFAPETGLKCRGDVFEVGATSVWVDSREWVPTL